MRFFSGPECPKIDRDWDFAPDSTGGAYSAPHSAPPDPLAGFREGPRKRDGEKGGKGRGKRGRGEEGGTGDLLHGLRGIYAPDHTERLYRKLFSTTRTDRTLEDRQ